jgi:hypothetical protein
MQIDVASAQILCCLWSHLAVKNARAEQQQNACYFGWQVCSSRHQVGKKKKIIISD